MSPYSFHSVATLAMSFILIAGITGVASAQSAAVTAPPAVPDDSASFVSPASAASTAVVETRLRVSDRVVPFARGPQLQPAGLQATVGTRSGPVDIDRERDVSVGSNLALMGVGAAAVVVGLLVGGDGGTAIAVGGGVLGLVGLYRYLR